MEETDTTEAVYFPFHLPGWYIYLKNEKDF
jgi:hypothetical protein